MVLHDWTRVSAGVYHGFHLAWIAAMREHLNGGLLPPEFYADAEQVARPYEGDLLTLREPATLFPPAGTGTGAVAVAAPEPRTRNRVEFRLPADRPRQRRLVIRHTSGHRVVALIELASPANKDRPASVGHFAGKAAAAIRQGIHVLLIDPFPPGKYDPTGLAGAVIEELRGPVDPEADAAAVPVPGLPREPLGFASFEAKPDLVVYLEPRAVGADVPTMPLFLAPGWYVNVPLGESYDRAWVGTPRVWRDVLTSPTVAPVE